MALRRSVGGDVTLRVVPGLYYEQRASKRWGKKQLFCRTVDGGFRSGPHRPWLQGRQCLELPAAGQPFGAGSDPSNIVDSCYPRGSIQVPAGLEPIVLHRDAVSGGGYAMIGTVISADLDLIERIGRTGEARVCGGDLRKALEARRMYETD